VTLASLRSHIPDAMMALGVCAVSYGAWLIYAPAGYIVGGLALAGFGVLAARAK